jgi:hypothetical protein
MVVDALALLLVQLNQYLHQADGSPAGTANPAVWGNIAQLDHPEIATELENHLVLTSGPFSFRKEVANQAQNELKGFVPRGASFTRHAPMTQNPFMKTDAHDTTAPSAHRGLL